MKPTRVFLSVQSVGYRKPAGADPFTYREKRPSRWRASWWTRGTSTELYRGKPVATQEEAVRLARKWLARENKTRAEGPVDLQLIDTTDHPERYGYAHATVGHAKKKPARQLDTEIAASLAGRSAKARREAALLERKRAASDQDTKWRLETIDQIQRWIQENNQGPWDARTYNLVIKRLAKLVAFVRSFFPEAGPAPFAPWDAAALIVLPRAQALRLARRLFGGGPGITQNLQVEDLWFNMDWFRPRDFQ